MRYRSNIRASDVAIFADVHVKFGAHAITGDRSIAEQATDAEWFDADVLIASGTRTGSPTEPREVAEVRAGTNLPVIVGSGLTADPCSLALSDGRRSDRRSVAQARWPLVEPGRSATRGAIDGGRRKISRWAVTLLTEATDVFAASEKSGRCLVAFAAKRQALASGVFGDDQARRLKELLQTLQVEGWLMSVRAMFEPDAPGEPYVFDTGFAHDVDMVGAFEAPSLSSALAGTIRLEQAVSSRQAGRAGLPRNGWSARGSSRPCGGTRGGADGIIPGAFSRCGNGMTPGPPRRERSAAPMTRNATLRSRAIVALGINIAGRHRLDWASRWHHAGLWEAPSLGSVDPRHARPRGGCGLQVHDLATLCRSASSACRLH